MVFGEGPEDRESHRKAKKTRESQRRPETDKESQRETENARESQRTPEKARKHTGDKLCVFNDFLVHNSCVFATCWGAIEENSHAFTTFLYVLCHSGVHLGILFGTISGSFLGSLFFRPQRALPASYENR